MTVKINEFVHVWNTKALGEHMAETGMQQVGIIRTQYVNNGDTSRGVEAVIADSLGNFFAVENHRGASFVAHIQDEEMLITMADFMASGVKSDEGFIYDQTVTIGVEEINPKHDDGANEEASEG